MATIRLYIIEVTYDCPTMKPDRFWAECENYLDHGGRHYECKGSQLYQLPDGVMRYDIRSIITENTYPVILTSNKAYPLEPVSELQTVCEQLAKLRKAQGITQKELADRLGLHQSEIARIERGENNISINRIAEIANALGKRIELV